jgi:hypothetical protein
MSLMNVSGKQLLNKKIFCRCSDNIQAIDLTSFPKGLYFLNLKNSMKTYTEESLIEALIEIRNQGWIPTRRKNNDGGVGNTLEDLLGIEENNLPIPNAAEWELKAQKKDTTSQLGYLKNVKKSGAEAVRAALEKTISHNIVIHPKMEAMSKKYPGLFELERCCPAVGHIIAAAREKISLSVRAIVFG